MKSSHGAALIRVVLVSGALLGALYLGARLRQGGAEAPAGSRPSARDAGDAAHRATWPGSTAAVDPRYRIFDVAGRRYRVPTQRLERLGLRAVHRSLFLQRLRELTEAGDPPPEACLGLARWVEPHGLPMLYGLALRWTLMLDGEQAEARRRLVRLRARLRRLPDRPEAGERLIRDLPEGFRLLRTAHFRIAYRGTESLARATGSLIEQVHRAFFRFFQARYFEPLPPPDRLEVVLFGSREAYRRHAAGYGSALRGSAGFYSSADHRSYFFDALSDPQRRRAHQELDDARDRLETLEREVLGGADADDRSHARETDRRRERETDRFWVRGRDGRERETDRRRERETDRRRERETDRRRERETDRFWVRGRDGRERLLDRAAARRLLREQRRRLRRAARRMDARYHQQNLARAVHEITHHLAYATGIHSRHHPSPRWVVEGLAMYFEATVDMQWEGPGALPTARLRRVARSVREGTWIPLARLVTTDSLFDQGGRRSLVAYDTAWSLFHFLAERRHDRLFDYLANLSLRISAEPDPPATRLRDIEVAFGPLRLLQQAWLRYVESLAR